MIYGKPIWEYDIEYPNQDIIIVKIRFRTVNNDAIIDSGTKPDCTTFSMPFAANKGWENGTYSSTYSVHRLAEYDKQALIIIEIKKFLDSEPRYDETIFAFRTLMARGK